MATDAAAAAEGQRSVMVVALDDSEHSYHAFQWTLDHFFATPVGQAFKLVVVHAQPTPTSVVGLAGPGSADVLPFIESDLKRIAARVVEKAKQMCAAKSVADVHVEVMEGDARNVLCEAVDKHHADMLVVGSHGYGVIKRIASSAFFLSLTSQNAIHHVRMTL